MQVRGLSKCKFEKNDNEKEMDLAFKDDSETRMSVD